MMDNVLVPAITFLTTYLESFGGILDGIPFLIFRPVQAFAGAFLGTYLVEVIEGSSIKGAIKSHALIGLQAAIGCVVGGVIGGALGLNGALSSASGAAIAVYLYKTPSKHLS